MSVSNPQAIPSSFADLKEHLKEKEREALNAAQLTDEDLSKVRDRLYRMIDYAVKRQDWYADQAHRLLQIGLALMASGVAIWALFLKVEWLSTLTLVLSWFLGLCPFVTGLVLAVLYQRELGPDRPYRRIVDIKSWFFAYVFHDTLASRISKRNDKARKQVEDVSGFLEQFFRQWLVRAKAPHDFLDEDLEQVAILMLLQRYRTQQVKRMATVLLGGLVITGFVFLTLFASFSAFDLPHRPAGAPAAAAATPSSTSSGKKSSAPPPTHPDVSTTPPQTTPQPTPPTRPQKP